ncbi:MAG TPA: hypothetical protein VF771_03760 [Longimicrobiaceae bacterium]
MRRISPILLALLTACASAGGGTPPPPSDNHQLVRDETTTGGSTTEVEINHDRRSADYTVAGNAERVFQTLPGIYALLGITGAGLVNPNPQQKTFGRQHMRLYHRLGSTPLSRIIDCGSTYAGDADTYDINMSVTTAVVPMGERSQIRTWVEASGRQQTSSSTPVTCTSKGFIEQSIYRMVNDSLAAHPGQ